MDLPQSYNDFCLELDAINDFKPSDWLSNIYIDDEDIDDFIRARNPINVSKYFGKAYLADVWGFSKPYPAQTALTL